MSLDWKQREGQHVEYYLRYIRKQLLRNGHHYGCRSSGLGCHVSNRDICAGRWLLAGIHDSIFNELSPDIKAFRYYMTFDELADVVQDAEYLSTMRMRLTPRFYFADKVEEENEDGFMVDEDGHIIVYTDGACPRNGQPGAQGGIGVWFGPYNKE